MTNIAIDLQNAIAERNYTTSSHLFDYLMKEREASILEEYKEKESDDSHPTLELRDHVMHYLGLWDLYFAIEIPSYEMLITLQDLGFDVDIQDHTIEYIRNLLDESDSRIDQSSINVETISRSQYAVILPHLLTQRVEELENCVIPYRAGPTPLYCTVNLLKTYYGRKIVSATLDGRLFEMVVEENIFAEIAESLNSAGLDVRSMLHPIEPIEWSEVVCNLTEQQASDTESRELRLLHRVKTARTEIFLDSFRKQVAALDTILSAKTQACNDVLMTIAANKASQMRRRAINALGQTGDSITMEFLSKMMHDRDDGTRIEATRAYSLLASQSQWSGVHHTISPSSEKVPLLDIAKINQVLNTLIAKGMPPAIIDDTLSAVAVQGGPHAVEVLERLLSKPQPQVRMAVVRASRLLDRDSAARIIKVALSDESPEVVELAEKEIDTRWSDEIW